MEINRTRKPRDYHESGRLAWLFRERNCGSEGNRSCGGLRNADRYELNSADNVNAYGRMFEAIGLTKQRHLQGTSNRYLIDRDEFVERFIEWELAGKSQCGKVKPVVTALRG